MMANRSFELDEAEQEALELLQIRAKSVPTNPRNQEAHWKGPFQLHLQGLAKFVTQSVRCQGSPPNLKWTIQSLQEQPIMTMLLGRLLQKRLIQKRQDALADADSEADSSIHATFPGTKYPDFLLTLVVQISPTQVLDPAIMFFELKRSVGRTYLAQYLKDSDGDAAGLHQGILRKLTAAMAQAEGEAAQDQRLPGKKAQTLVLGASSGSIWTYAFCTMQEAVRPPEGKVLVELATLQWRDAEESDESDDLRELSPEEAEALDIVANQVLATLLTGAGERASNFSVPKLKHRRPTDSCPTLCICTKG